MTLQESADVLETASTAVSIGQLFEEHGRSLVRLARFFVDDRNAAEDLVQEAFIRLSRARHRIKQPSKAVAYLRSIVLNLARDHNRRGLVSLRHRQPAEKYLHDSAETQLTVRDDQKRVIDALASLPLQQRNSLVLRYYLELSIPEIAETLEVSANTVKTHLRRGMAALRTRLERTQ